LHNLAKALVSLDASVALDFHLTKSTDVLVELFEGKMLYADFVKHQLPPTVNLTGARIIRLRAKTDWAFLNELKIKEKGLGLGELSSIVIAKKHSAALLTNEKCARQAAEAAAIHVVGSIGVLDFAVEQGKMQGLAALGLLQEMVTHGARVPAETINEVRQRWAQQNRKDRLLVRTMVQGRTK
jgi:predicted nucleic acid-binding protein